MKVLTVRNVHVALPQALKLLNQEGIERASRNGPVRMAPCPVTTVYTSPMERVLFWSARDANPALHLYESLWMLAGRNDISYMARYAKNVVNYSDDGKTWRGAYGHRWRWNSKDNHIVPFDQLTTIIRRLKKNPEDRRSVLQMWDSAWDLHDDDQLLDLPCNLTATFQRDVDGKLDLTVFCRSNDIIFGCYGSNAVHFSLLLEYMALGIGCPIGVYRQVSVNWHAYVDILKQVARLLPDRGNYVDNPYARAVGDQVHVVPMEGTVSAVDSQISEILRHADVETMQTVRVRDSTPWAQMVWLVLEAHEAYRLVSRPTNFEQALEILKDGDPHADWIVSMREWLQRRQVAWHAKHDLLAGDLSHP